ncbi:hypothetical protein [Flavobacterium cellulosilyticum]|uniref:Uncharacterized protein n=1 Tax=Flavobacterium cellulosilyticum TaxID=2541731 RepID=A0A4R5C7H0_9FLAO|nr:hypothetical protein [Flavobacterium cellulosilyticum]TDD94669.1 hypothetical protein E0F76_15630 [Flavobacterium cellulosilyticum]
MNSNQYYNAANIYNNAKIKAIPKLKNYFLVVKCPQSGNITIKTAGEKTNMKLNLHPIRLVKNLIGMFPLKLLNY